MKSIIYVGNPGFPKGLAQVQRQYLIAKGLSEEGCRVMILSRYGILEKESILSVNPSGIFENIEYKFCSGLSYKPKNFFKRNLLKIKGFIIELLTIIKERFIKKANILIISSNSFWGILYYTSISKILNFTSIVDQVEFWSAHNRGFYKKIDSYLNDNFYGYLSDKVIVISDFLYSKLQHSCPNKPVIKIPAICDFSKFENNIVNAFF